jgi:hypothetical protein
MHDKLKLRFAGGGALAWVKFKMGLQKFAIECIYWVNRVGLNT